MLLHGIILLYLIILLGAVNCSTIWENHFLYTEDKLEYIKGVVKDAFQHAFFSYRDLAMADGGDELNPIDCKGVGGRMAGNSEKSQVLVGVYLTLIDALDTLVILGMKREFIKAVLFLKRSLSFKRLEMEASVFEMNIRVLGGLLAAHHMALDPRWGIYPPNQDNVYSGTLKDLGQQMLNILEGAWSISAVPSTIVQSGPYSRPAGKSRDIESSTAQAGSYILEFGVASKTFSTKKYLNIAMAASKFIWKNRDSSTNLLGSVFIVDSSGERMRWKRPVSHLGGDSDSYYEYLIKGSILLGRRDLFAMFFTWYESLLLHTGRVRGRPLSYYPYAAMSMADPRRKMHPMCLDGLSAFFPSIQVLYGDIGLAIEHYLWFFLTALKYGGLLPESYNLETNTIEKNEYLLRPELAESTYYLYQATRDPFFLWAGQVLFSAIEIECRTKCGYAVASRIFPSVLRYGRMDSFFLAETLKYFYLLFDIKKGTEIHRDYVFSTEGHLFSVPKAKGYKKGGKVAKLNLRPCQIYDRSWTTLTRKAYSKNWKASKTRQERRHAPLFPISQIASLLNLPLDKYPNLLLYDTGFSL